MVARKQKLFSVLGIAVIAFLALPRFANAQRLKPIPPRGTDRGHGNYSTNKNAPWTPLTNQPTFIDDINCAGAANPLLLTDGTVIVQSGGCQEWWKLTPDARGSYVNGTWSQLASLPADYSPLYHSSAVLPDGRVIIEGGEYNFFNADWTDKGAIYDPLANVWTSMAPPPFFGDLAPPPPQTIGDAQSVVLANGTYMQADCCTMQAALLDAQTLTWTPTGTGKFDIYDEEGFTLLPSGKVLTVDAYVPIGIPYEPTGTNSEIYDPNTGSWSSAGSTIVQLWDSAAACGGERFGTFELGPGVLRPDGTVFYTGADTCQISGGPNPVFANGHTAIYNSSTGTWTPGPDFTGGNNIADGPASLETNGKVLMMASPSYGAPPSTFFEWDGQKLYTVPGTPNAPYDGSFYGNMLVLPTGQILLTDFSDDIELYTPQGGGPQPQWGPVLTSYPSSVQPGGSYTISGIRFNGMSQGAAYGDDVQAATNYPIVRITNMRTGHVFYSRTHDHSSMAVASNDVVSTTFDVPASQEAGFSKIEVVANGIPSHPNFLTVQ